MLRFRDRESYAGNKTKEYDDIAMKYLSYVLFFLVACSSVYSLMYERHKSWYSWILSSLTSCVYMFGKLLFSSIHALSSIFLLKPFSTNWKLCYRTGVCKMFFQPAYSIVILGSWLENIAIFVALCSWEFCFQIVFWLIKIPKLFDL